MDLPSWIDKEAWEAYLEMRKSIKKPMKTERAIKLAIHKLEVLLKQGHDPTAVLDQSIFNSWQGLFPIKDEGKNGQNATGSGRAGGRNFAEEDAQQRRERDARILARGNSLAGGVHREEAFRAGREALDGEASEVPEVEAG